MRSLSTSPITGPRTRSAVRGFTLVELLVATVILLLIMALVLSITDQTSKIWKTSTAKIQGFQSARAAYDTMTMRLRQATLNTSLDYYDSTLNPRTPASVNFVPAFYARNSDLHFVVDQSWNIFTATPGVHPAHSVFFQAPLGVTSTSGYAPLQSMLNACGYYVEFSTDKPSFPPFLSAATAVHERYRYRLMEFLQPGEANTIYSTSYTAGMASTVYNQWFTNFLPTSLALVNTPPKTPPPPYHVLAENIIALVVCPELTAKDQSIAPNYTYDSRAGDITKLPHHQLPPILRVVMVAIDEPSATRLNPNGSTTPPTTISTLFQQGSSALFQTPYNPPYSSTTAANNPAPNNLDADLAKLTAVLTAQKINYRVYDTDIAIHGAKWSVQ